MYAKAKIGGFLHLAIGEEATIVGAVRALRDTRLPDLHLPLARPRARARHAAQRASWPSCSASEDGCSRGRGGSMHMFDSERRFMGGYGIVGGNLPIGAGARARLRLHRHRGRDAVRVRRRRLEPGHLRRDDEPRRAVEAAGRLHGHQQPVRDGHRARAPLRRRPTSSSAARASACPALRCDGMDVVDTHRVICEARAARARGAPAACWWRRSPTASAATRWPTPRSTAPRSRSPSGASATRSRPSATGSSRRACSRRTSVERARRSEAIARVDEAVAFADDSPFPAPESLYDDVYVLGDQVRGWYSVDERSPGVHRARTSASGRSRTSSPRRARPSATAGDARRRTQRAADEDASESERARGRAHEDEDDGD